MIVREATPADIPAIVALNAEVHDIHLRLFSDIFKPIDPAALADWYHACLNDEKMVILVAEEGNEVVAHLIMRKQERPASSAHRLNPSTGQNRSSFPG